MRIVFGCSSSVAVCAALFIEFIPRNWHTGLLKAAEEQADGRICFGEQRIRVCDALLGVQFCSLLPGALKCRRRVDDD